MSNRKTGLKNFIIRIFVEHTIKTVMSLLIITLLGGFLLAFFNTPEPSIVTSFSCPHIYLPVTPDMINLTFTVEDYKNLDSVLIYNITSESFSFSYDERTFVDYVDGELLLPPNGFQTIYTKISLRKSIHNKQINFTLELGCRQKIWWFFDRYCRNVVQPRPCKYDI